MLNFNSILLFSENPKALGEFYKKVFESDPVWNEGDYVGFQVGSSHIVIGPHDQVKGKAKDPSRILLNFETKNVEDEFNRIESLGAKVIKAPYHPGEDPKGTIATFEDPDGNLFQLMTPMSA